MKTFITRRLFLNLLFITSLLSSCSDSDDTNDQRTPFEPVTINLQGLGVQLDDTSFTVESFSFSAFRVQSTTAGSFDGIELAFPQDGNSSQIELNLGGVSGISTITVTLFNNGVESTQVSALNGSATIAEIVGDAISSGETTVELDVSGQTITTLRISSLEATIQSIRLE